MAKIDIVIGGETITVNEWALEDTQEKMLKAIEALGSVDKEQQASLKKLVNATTSFHKSRSANDDKEEVFRNQQLNAMKEIAESGTVVDSSSLMSALSGTGGALLKLTGVILGTTVSAITALGIAAYNVGNVFRDLSDSGVGLNQAGDIPVSELIEELGFLGVNMADSGAMLREFSSVVQEAGKGAFLQYAQDLSDATSNGVELGMTFAELIEFAAEDLEMRRQLGIQDQIVNAQFAKDRAAQFKKDLANTALMGRTLDDIRGASRNVLDSSREYALAMLGLPKDQRIAFTTAFQGVASDLKATEVPQSMIDAIGVAMIDINAFQSEAARDLMTNLQKTGTASGTALVGFLQNINDTFKTSPAEAEKLMKELPGRFASLAIELSEKGADGARQLQAMFADSSGMGQDFALSMNRMIAVLNKNTGELDDLAMTTARVENSFKLVTGSFSAIKLAIITGLEEPITALADILTDEDNGIIPALRDGAQTITRAIKNVFSPGLEEAGDATTTLKDKIQNWLIPKIKGFSESIADFIRNDGLTKIKEGFDAFVDGLKAVVKFMNKFADKEVKVGGVIVERNDQTVGISEEQYKKASDAISKMAEGEERTQITKKVEAARDIGKNMTQTQIEEQSEVGSRSALENFSSTVDWDGIGQKIAQGILVGVVALGVGAALAGGFAAAVGAGAGVGLAGLSKGLAAMATPKVGLGIAAIGALGFAISQFPSQVFKDFEDISWESIAQGFVTLAGAGAIAAAFGLFAPAVIAGSVAIGALGLALQAFPTELFTTIGKALGDYNTSLAQAEKIKIDAQAAATERLSKIDPSRILSMSDAIKALATGFQEFGDVVGSTYLGFIDTGLDVDKQDKLFDMFSKFASLDNVGLSASASAIKELAIAYRYFNAIDYDNLEKTASAIKLLNNNIIGDKNKVVFELPARENQRIEEADQATAIPANDSQTDQNTANIVDMSPDKHLEELKNITAKLIDNKKAIIDLTQAFNKVGNNLTA